MHFSATLYNPDLPAFERVMTSFPKVCVADALQRCNCLGMHQLQPCLFFQ